MIVTTGTKTFRRPIAVGSGTKVFIGPVSYGGRNSRAGPNAISVVVASWDFFSSGRQECILEVGSTVEQAARLRRQ